MKATTGSASAAVMMSLVREMFRGTGRNLMRSAECGMRSSRARSWSTIARLDTPHSSLHIPHSCNLIGLGLVRRKASCNVVREGMRVIERARVQPHAPGARRPGVPNGAGEQVLAETAPDRLAHDPEVGDLDRVVVGDPPQLVPAGEPAVAPGDV